MTTLELAHAERLAFAEFLADRSTADLVDLLRANAVPHGRSGCFRAGGAALTGFSAPVAP